MDASLKNKIAVVTGARRGIGKAIALAFAQNGVHVVVSDIVTEDGLLEQTAAELRMLSGKSLALRADVAQKSEVDVMIRQVRDAFGRIDNLVNCAGIWRPGQTLIECSDENWDDVINTNLKGTFLCCRSAGKIMIEQRSGNIINISSQVGLTPGRGIGAYSISKAGIIMLTRQLALELAPFNIRVNALAPGIVKTEFNAAFWKDPEVEKKTSQMVPLGRLAETHEIAESALYLASDRSSYVTGEVIRIAGGWTPAAS